MLVFNEEQKPIIFDNVHTPTNVEYFWVLDLKIMDVTLTPLYVLEELVCPAILLSHKGFEFYLPTIYYILIFSEETSQIDTINIGELASNNFHVVLDGMDVSRIQSLDYRIIDFKQEHTFVLPLLEKSQLLCHPVSPNKWINISANDQQKNLTNKVIGDLIYE